MNLSKLIEYYDSNVNKIYVSSEHYDTLLLMRYKSGKGKVENEPHIEGKYYWINDYNNKDNVTYDFYYVNDVVAFRIKFDGKIKYLAHISVICALGRENFGIDILGGYYIFNDKKIRDVKKIATICSNKLQNNYDCVIEPCSNGLFNECVLLPNKSAIKYTPINIISRRRNNMIKSAWLIDKRGNRITDEQAAEIVRRNRSEIEDLENRMKGRSKADNLSDGSWLRWHDLKAANDYYESILKHIEHVEGRKIMNSRMIKSSKETLYEDDGGRFYTWSELKADIDDFVKTSDFKYQFEGDEDMFEYFEKDHKTPKYYKIYMDFWDISSNGAMSEVEGTEEQWNEYNEQHGITSAKENNMKKNIKSSNGSWEYQSDDMDEVENKIGDIGISFTEPLLLADDGTIYTRTGFNEWLKYLEKEYSDNWYDAYENYHCDSDKEFIEMCKEDYFHHDFGYTLTLYKHGLKDIAKSITKEIPSNKPAFAIPSGFAFELYPEEEESSGFNPYWIDDLQLNSDSFIWGINPSLGNRFDVAINPDYLWNGNENITSNRRTNMKKTIKSGRFIKSGAGAGYDVTIEGIELDTQNIEILEQDNDSVHVKIPVKPCIVDKWTAQSYYDGIDSDWGDGFFGDDDRRIDGGYVNMTIDIWENETAEEVIKNVPHYIDVKASYGWGWVHVNLPEEGMQFDYDHIKEPDIGAYGEIHLDEVDLICPEICADINAFFENPEGYYEGNEIDYNYDEDDEITNGLSFREAVKDFKSAGKWSDYWEMQQDWEAYKDGLERDGVITEKSRSSWGNPCTPESFKRWNK